MPFCPSCGMEASDDARFCKSCGKSLSPASAQAGKAPPTGTGSRQTAVHYRPAPDVPRLSGVGITKFLAPDERMLHVTPGRIRYGGQLRHAYVTSKRVILYGREGAMLGLVRQDRLDEVFLNQIRKLKLVETGVLLKNVHLEIDDMKLEGQRGHLLGLYKGIQAARGSF